MVYASSSSTHHVACLQLSSLKTILLILLSCCVCNVVHGFILIKSITESPKQRRHHSPSIVPLFASASSSTDNEEFLPTMEQLSTDPFMDQVNYGSSIASLLVSSNDNDDNEQQRLTEMISAQLSHSDGIRGFFVSYLTGDGGDAEHPADLEEEIPKPLRDAIMQVLHDQDNNKSKDDLISLMCMNVIMPTAMTSMHTNPQLIESSRKTALRSIKIAKFLMQENKMKQQCHAIFEVATSTTTLDTTTADDSVDVKYWLEFFEKWGYGPKQKEDIAKAMNEVLLNV